MPSYQTRWLGEKSNCDGLNSREAVERSQAAFAGFRLIIQIAQFGSVVEFGAGAKQPSHALRRNAGEAANLAAAVFDQQQSGIGIVVKRFLPRDWIMKVCMCTPIADGEGAATKWLT
nr:hypothetical protein [Rhizobium laguerreae]